MMTIAFVILLIAFVLACLVGWFGYWLMNEETEAVERRAEHNLRVANRLEEDNKQLTEQLGSIESDYQQFRQVSINQSHLQSEENKRLREEIANHEKIAAANVVEIQRLSDNLTAWVEKHDRLTAKASELCEVLRGDS